MLVFNFILYLEKTGNIGIVSVFKTVEILLDEEIFYEEIAFSFKRLMWNGLMLIAYIIAFSLEQTRHPAFFVFLKTFTLFADYLLYKTGSFFRDTTDELIQKG